MKKTKLRGVLHMAELQSAHRGCLLGLAVGDAMGYAVDSKSWAEIQEDYGPNGDRKSTRLNSSH